ncbi:uncharacterized protein LOC110013731 isoform X2 [Oryzias latipes]
MALERSSRKIPCWETVCRRSSGSAGSGLWPVRSVIANPDAGTRKKQRGGRACQVNGFNGQVLGGVVVFGGDPGNRRNGRGSRCVQSRQNEGSGLRLIQATTCGYGFLGSLQESILHSLHDKHGHEGTERTLQGHSAAGAYPYLWAKAGDTLDRSPVCHSVFCQRLKSTTTHSLERNTSISCDPLPGRAVPAANILVLSWKWWSSKRWLKVSRRRSCRQS